MFCFSRTTLYRDTLRSAWLCPVVLYKGIAANGAARTFCLRIAYLSRLPGIAYCFRKWNCCLSTTCVRPRETVRSVSVVTTVLTICDIQFEKFHSIEKFINPRGNLLPWRLFTAWHWTNLNGATVAQSIFLLSFWLDNPGFGARQEKKFSGQCPDRSHGPPKILFIGYWQFLPGRGGAGAGADRAWGWPTALLCLVRSSRNNGALPPISAYAFVI